MSGILQMASLSLNQPVELYRLQTDFASATPAQLTDSQVLDTVAEGVPIGILNVVETDEKYLVISGSQLRPNGLPSINYWDTRGVTHGGYQKSGNEGLILRAKLHSVVSPPSGRNTRMVFGLNNTEALNTPTATPSFYLLCDLASTNALRIYHPAGNLTLPETVTYGDTIHVALVVGGEKFFAYTKFTGETEWTLQYVAAMKAGTHFYPYVTFYTTADECVGFSSLYVPTALSPELADTTLYNAWVAGGSIPMTDPSFAALDF